jgi:hypothetical protein
MRAPAPQLYKRKIALILRLPLHKQKKENSTRRRPEEEEKRVLKRKQTQIIVVINKTNTLFHYFQNVYY